MPGDRESSVAVAAKGRRWSAAPSAVNQQWHSLAHPPMLLQPEGGNIRALEKYFLHLKIILELFVVDTGNLAIYSQPAPMAQ